MPFGCQEMSKNGNAPAQPFPVFAKRFPSARPATFNRHLLAP